MSGSVVSKNLYELLGNDPELDPEREPEPPTKAIDKPTPRAGKRNGGAEAPVKEAAGARGGRRENVGGSEGAFRDRNAGAANNRSKPTDDGLRQDRHPDRLRDPNEHRDIGNRGRGSRGGRGFGGRGTRTGRDDRHSRTGVADHPKQAAHGWGGETGGDEFADEIAGEAIAKQEEKAGFDTNPDAPVNAEGAAPDGEAAAEAEDKSKSYDEYLKELAEKKLQLGGNLEIRKPNEGTSKKMPEGKPIAKSEEEDFIAASVSKKQRERAQKEIAKVDLGDIYGRGEERSGFRGGRGGARGGGRGGRSEGGFRGEGRGRGGRGRGEGGFRGGPRGGAPRGGTAVKLDDPAAFPSLGA
ncbi:hypothetical protein K490DRAFT_52994 [Saccharata proteae CBS 121410]|uniref:Hyaluronan/mRNA-binding protein domain-containing protein n=1 Tax=Saccharata proteae CBS 121410 TaxID=1314787 RepID=A0A9P4M033_9PEZI|nr:hypothetical protein K490DRAFT_52994 [Saccharata proteae CBS 121410]